MNTILDNAEDFYGTALGQVLGVFNNNFKPFVSSLYYYRPKETHLLTYFIKLGALLDLSESPYSSNKLKETLEKLNLKFSQVDSVSAEDLFCEMKAHITKEFNRVEVEETLLESGLPNSLVYLNDYLYAQDKKTGIFTS